MIENRTFDADIEAVLLNKYIDWELMRGKSFFVTGATGLIGTLLVNSLVAANRKIHLDIKITVLVRNIEKAEKRLDKDDCLSIIVGDVLNIPEVNDNIDFIVHAASNTSSKAFVENPVEVSKTTLLGTMNLLELAKIKKVSSFVFLSTMEVYGTPHTDEKISENHGTDLKTMVVRTCYPEGKRMCENLCASYNFEYAVPTKVLCLTQTFGPGVEYSDGRVFAEFARCSIENRNIVLHTKGETKRNYLYTVDAISAILLVLLKGQAGEKYNAANEDTYCSIYEMAQMVANDSNNNIMVEIQETDAEKLGYAPVLHMNLDTTKLCDLGWRADTGLTEMFRNLISYMKEERSKVS